MGYCFGGSRLAIIKKLLFAYRQVHVGRAKIDFSLVILLHSN